MAKRRMRFITWCKKDINDKRKINYTLKTYDEKIEKFTSEDLMPHSMMVRLQTAWIDTIELVDNEWNVLLYEER